MSKVKIALLDTGISKEIKDDRIKVRKSIRYDYLNDGIVITDSFDDYNGHGTMCYNTIKMFCSNCEIYSIDILGISGLTSNKILLAALEYVEQLDVDVISLCASCLVRENRSDLRTVCERIRNSGKIIVASVENGKETSAIAEFDSVIGVIGNPFRYGQYSFSKSMGIQMSCDSSMCAVRGLNNTFSLFNGNSRATAIATGLVADALANRTDNVADIEDILEKNKTCGRDVEEDFFWKIEQEIFDADEEDHLAETDDRYIEFLYLLCECFVCRDPDHLRNECLCGAMGVNLRKRIHGLISAINERFGVEIDELYVPDIVWPYVFYRNFVSKDGNI